MPGYQALSFIRRASAATAKLLLCRLTEKVGVIPLFSSWIFLFSQLFARFIARIPLLYYAVHFLTSFCQKNPSEPTEQQQFVLGRAVPAKDVNTVCARAFVMIEIGAKNEVFDPVYPLSCLPSWSKPLSYRKLPNILRASARLLNKLYHN